MMSLSIPIIPPHVGGGLEAPATDTRRLHVVVLHPGRRLARPLRPPRVGSRHRRRHGHWRRHRCWVLGPGRLALVDEVDSSHHGRPVSRSPVLPLSLAASGPASCRPAPGRPASAALALPVEPGTNTGQLARTSGGTSCSSWSVVGCRPSAPSTCRTAC